MIDNQFDSRLVEELKEDLIDQEYDSIQFRNKLDGWVTIIPFSKKSLLDKANLKEIYNQANQSPIQQQVNDAAKIEQRAIEKGGNAKNIEISSIKKVDESIKDSQTVKDFRKMIKEDGNLDRVFKNKPVITSGGIVSDGNNRIMAAKLEWYTNVPVVQMPSRELLKKKNSLMKK